VDLATRARSAPPAEITALLRADFAFWREMHASSGFLISKMIAVAGLRQHFFFANLVLREMPASPAELLADWALPFSDGELSLRQSMAGELKFGEHVLRQWFNGESAGAQAADTWESRVALALARPYLQPQDQLNRLAAEYQALVQEFAVPLSNYRAVEKRRQAAPPKKTDWQVYNLMGAVLRSLANWDYTSYAMRVARVEGQRRAALLTAQLRQRAVPAQSVAGELAGGLRDPFDDAAFVWNVDEQAVVYAGPAAEASRQRHVYFY
jgi:hypothetical protein